MSEIKISEGAVVNACIRWLFLHGCYVWRNNTGAWKPEGSSRYISFGKRGSADIIGVTPRGVFLAVECKAKGGKQSPEQKEFERAVSEKNGIYILAYSVDDLEAAKDKIINQPKEGI